MSGSVTARRAYRSPLRKEQAAHTRQRIIEAAAQLFSTRGYGGTTMSDIAREADVSVESVHAAGAKATLLLEAFRGGLGGHAESASMFEVDSVKKIVEEGDVDADVALDRVVELFAAAHERSARIMLELRNVAATDPALSAEWTRHVESRRHGFRAGAEWLSATGIIEDGTAPSDVEPLAASVSSLMSAETYIQLTDDWGFDADQYRTWLGRQLRRLRP